MHLPLKIAVTVIASYLNEPGSFQKAVSWAKEEHSLWDTTAPGPDSVLPDPISSMKCRILMGN